MYIQVYEKTNMTAYPQDHATPEIPPQHDPAKELFRDSDNWTRLWVLKANTSLKDDDIATPMTRNRAAAQREAMRAQGADPEDIDRAVQAIIAEDAYVKAKFELVRLLSDECDVVDESDDSPLHSLLVAVSERAVTKEEELLFADATLEVQEELTQQRIRDDFKGLFTLYIAGKSKASATTS
jgi:hypothetical protein